MASQASQSHDCISMLTKIQVSANDDDTPTSPQAQVPQSPPPSFRSRDSSPSSRRISHSPHSSVNQNLADTFDADGSDSDEDNDGDDRQRLMRGTPSTTSAEQTTSESTSNTRPPVIERRDTHIPAFVPPRPSGRVYGGGSGSDGVFANLSAKPERGGAEKEEHPPVSSSTTLGTKLCTNVNRPTSKLPRMPLLHIGKLQF